jgi:drug/metabolite transporter (DMT)-like permease
MIAYALSKLSTSIMASYLYLIPIVSILIAWVWLKEILTLLSLVGGTVILFGLLLVNRRDKMTPKG